MVHALENDTNKPIEAVAPWGEIQQGDKDCMITMVFDPDNPNQLSTDRYIIGKDKFNNTYVSIEDL